MLPILALLLAAGVSAQTADLVLTGARIYTLNPAQPVASAVAVKDGRILAVGQDVSRHVGGQTRRVDVRGGTVIPGLIDSHVHMEGLGDLLDVLDLRQVRSVAAVAELVRREAARRPAGEWIRGRSWDQTHWGGQFPTARDLARAAPDHPVYLTRVDGHAAWVNPRALELAGVTAATPDPPGGKIIRDASGAPTGVLIDRAMGLVGRRIPAPGKEVTLRRLAAAARECARLGLTTVHDAGVGVQGLAAYRELIARGELPVRVYVMIGGPGALWRDFLVRGPEVGDRLTVRSIKLMADGALGSRGAALLAPYDDDPGNVGLVLTPPDELARAARIAAESGFQLAVHAIGDRANRAALDAFAAAGAGRDLRFRVEHAQVIAPEDIPRFAALGAVASMQPTHATSDMPWAEARVGPRRIRGAYAWRSILKTGAHVAFGSDFPVEEASPLLGIYAAVTRQDAEGQPAGGWRPEERLTLDEAIRAFTVEPAWAAFAEARRGVIAPGFAADLTVFDRALAPSRTLLAARAELVLVGGRVAYELPDRGSEISR